MIDIIDLFLPNSTPILCGDDAIDFMNIITEDLKHPVGMVPTPNLKNAVKLIREKNNDKTTD